VQQQLLLREFRRRLRQRLLGAAQQAFTSSFADQIRVRLVHSSRAQRNRRQKNGSPQQEDGRPRVFVFLLFWD